MQVTCPACSTRYTTDDAKVRGKTVRMRCRACDTVWLVQGPPKPGASRAREGEDLATSVRKPATYAPPPLAGYEAPPSQSRAPSHMPEPVAVPVTRPDKPDKRAAVVRRGADREHRDLFATQAPDEGSVKQTLRPPPAGLLGVGARSEDSVLFTVDSLRAAARVETPAPQPWGARAAAQAPSDDEGLIDLNALAARAAAPAPSPFGSPSEPPVGFAREVGGSSGYPTSPAATRRGPWIAAAASLAAMTLAAVSAVALFGGAVPKRAERPVPRIAVAANALAARAHDLELAKTAAADKAAADKRAAEAPDPSGKKTTKGGKAGRAPMGGRGTVAASAAPKAAPKPSADACGCKGDFTCILRCSAKGK